MEYTFNVNLLKVKYCWPEQKYLNIKPFWNKNFYVYLILANILSC